MATQRRLPRRFRQPQKLVLRPGGKALRKTAQKDAKSPPSAFPAAQIWACSFKKKSESDFWHFLLCFYKQTAFLEDPKRSIWPRPATSKLRFDFSYNSLWPYKSFMFLSGPEHNDLILEVMPALSHFFVFPALVIAEGVMHSLE